MNRLAVVACTTLLAACATDVGPEGDGLVDEDDVALVAKPDVVANGIKGDDVVANGLMFIPDNVRALVSWPLASDTFRPGFGPPELTALPCDAATMKFVRYLIETALEPGQTVEFCGQKTDGVMGMHPKWNTDKPTKEGREATTAGLLARVNPVGVPVVISPRALRPEKPEFSIQGPVPADIFDNTPDRKPIPSLHDGCSPTDTGAARNCGWSRDYAFVGTCTPGKQVEAGAGASPSCGAPLGWSVDDTVMRLCIDEFGCDEGGPNWIKSVEDNPCGGREPATTFTCPATGVFTAMLSGVTEATAFDGAVEVSSPAPVKFPVQVKDFFKVTEGGFYGDLFDDLKLNPNIKIEFKGKGGRNETQYIIHVDKATKEHTGAGSDHIYVFEDAFACHDPAWTVGEAYSHVRLCADAFVQTPSGGSMESICVSQPLGPCNQVPAEDPANFCGVYDQFPMLGDVDHDDCPDVLGNKREWPVTVFLHDACDLLSKEHIKQGLCRRGRK